MALEIDRIYNKISLRLYFLQSPVLMTLISILHFYGSFTSDDALLTDWIGMNFPDKHVVTLHQNILILVMCGLEILKLIILVMENRSFNSVQSHIITLLDPTSLRIHSNIHVIGDSTLKYSSPTMLP